MASDLVIISHQAAKAAGLARYFTGKPCKHGHIAERYISGMCVPCTVGRAAAWRDANPDKKRANDANYYVRRSEVVKARSRKWDQNNKDRKRAICRDWASSHREEMRHYRMASRAKKWGCESDLTLAELLELRVTQKSCKYCASTSKLTVDHIVPLAKRGPNTRSNIQILCFSCNSQKRDLDETEFLHSRSAA